MKFKHINSLLAVLLCVATGSAIADASKLYDPSIKHAPQDGVLKFYGAGGPHTAFKKVAEQYEKDTGQKVEIIAGPEKTWSLKAQADADMLWGTSEQSMTAFLETYKTLDSAKVEPIYIRPAVIAVKKGNPKNIQGIADLLKPGMKIVVTEGSGVSNTSGTGVWEDVAGRLGRLDDVKAFRKNIVSYSTGSGASYKAIQTQNADAWITWPNWPIVKSDDLELVKIEPARAIWRDVNVVISPLADPNAKQFVEFLVSAQGQKLMATEGWVRN